MEVSAINGLTVVTPKGYTDKTGWDDNEKGAETEKDTRAFI